MEYTLYLGLGAMAGVIGGLFGLGGGVIIVPILIIAFELQGLPHDIATHMAVSTSLATIIFTSIPSIYTHAQKGAVRWDLAQWISPGIVLGAMDTSTIMSAEIVPAPVHVAGRERSGYVAAPGTNSTSVVFESSRTSSGAPSRLCAA